MSEKHTFIPDARFDCCVCGQGRMDENHEINLFGKQLAAAEDLAKALETMMGHIESGTLVRDITKDGQADWAINMMKFCTDLNKANAALSAWRKARGE